jgi:2-C-methyl-D-erythritol 4-phosphate cytidylyltransferase
VIGVGYSVSAMEPSAILPLPTAVDPVSGCRPLAGRTPVARALDALLPWVAARRLVVVVAESAHAAVRDAVEAEVVLVGVEPAADWRQCVGIGLERLAAEPLSPVLVHDWRHPLAPADVTDRVLAELSAGWPVVVPVADVTDSVKEVGVDGEVVATVDRTTLRNVQYPRGFTAAALAGLLARGADPVAAALAAGESVRTVDGHADACRFTLPADAALLEAIITTRR